VAMKAYPLTGEFLRPVRRVAMPRPEIGGCGARIGEP